jgi:hypothetical protein
VRFDRACRAVIVRGTYQGVRTGSSGGCGSTVTVQTDYSSFLTKLGVTSAESAAVLSRAC